MDTAFHSELEVENNCSDAHVFSLPGRKKESCWSNQTAIYQELEMETDVYQELATKTDSPPLLLATTMSSSSRRHSLVMIQ
jgi:hypothetical protein